jgi:3,4-dehydroadipyl-CoA semialdehyde dehydrogenase
MHPESLEVVLWKNPGLLNTNCSECTSTPLGCLRINFEFLQSALPMRANNSGFVQSCCRIDFPNTAVVYGTVSSSRKFEAHGSIKSVQENSLILSNYISGEWKQGKGEGIPLIDPVSGEHLAHASSDGLDLAEALKFSRERGSRVLQRLNYQHRAELLAKIAEVLSSQRDEYYEICLKNMGATKGDAAFDVDGAIYTLKHYAKVGQKLDGDMIKDGPPVALSKSGVFQGQHFLRPLEGAAVLIDAFNFPAWGLWEKAAPALLSGVAVFVKPATPTAWLTQRMIQDVVKAGILPDGALSIICGSPGDLLDHLTAHDVIAFTGSAATAAKIKTHPSVVAHSVRVNIEADSLNSAILGADAPGTQPFELLVKEVVKEMTQKAGQKCTAIRRIFVPRRNLVPVCEAIASGLAAIPVGNPRNAAVKCGPLVNKAQQKGALDGLAQLKRECSVIFGGDETFQPIDADSGNSCFVQPTLLRCEDPLRARIVHEVEVFGPVATIMPYDTVDEAIELARRGHGSLVASIFSDDDKFKDDVARGLATTHGRIMVVDSSVGPQHTGHGNVMPNCLHGGPGRAGGGEELGGLRALQLYHRRFVVQGPPELLSKLSQNTIEIDALHG